MKAKFKGKYSKPTRKYNSSAVNAAKKAPRLSRKDREFVSEYGQLHEDALGGSDNEILEQGQIKRRIFKEEELDQQPRQKTRKQADSESDDNLDDVEDFAENSVSAYDLLLQSLKKNSQKNKSMWKRLEKEQQGVDEDEDDDVEDAENKDTEDVSDDEASNDEEIEAESLSAKSEKDTDEDVSEQEESDREAATDDGIVDELQNEHFDLSQEQADKLAQLATELSKKNFNVDQVQEEHLGQVTAQTLASSTTNFNLSKFFAAENLKIKQRLLEPWKNINGNYEHLFTDEQRKLFTVFESYRDFLYTDESFENHRSLMQLYALHSMNHIFKTRDTVLKNNEKIKKAQETRAEVDIRDQGFTRPKVLVILPMRNTAFDFINMLIELSGSTQQENKKRFMDEFSGDDSSNSRKPLDYQQTFRGNIDDCFRIGIKFSRKAMKFYSEFYSSDIIVASPLGLRMIIGSDGDKKRDFDFLSSIEVVIMDQTDVLLMQNWDHVIHLYNHLNLFPKEMRDCDFSRVRSWYLDGHAKLLRQNLIFSRFNSPEINYLFNNQCLNIAGKIKTRKSHRGAVNDVIPRVQHIFTCVEASSLAAANDARFKYFTEKTIPTLRASVSLQSHTCIFIPSYFDFLRIRNWMDKMEIPYGDVNEYSSQADAQRSRHDFFKGEVPFLLTTERAHFFRRYRIRGIKNLVFYGLPDYSLFYSDFTNMLVPESSSADNSAISDDTAAAELTSTITVLYTKYDALKLERVVGTKRVEKMIFGKKSTFMFA